MAKKHLLLKHLALVCPNNFKVFDAFTKEELDIENHLEDEIIKVYRSDFSIYVKDVNDAREVVEYANHLINLSGNTYHSITNHCYYKVVQLSDCNGIWVTLKSYDTTRKIDFDYFKSLIDNGTMQLVN